MSREEFIDKYRDWAISSTYGTGIFPSVKMAQAIIESASSRGVPGESSLADKYNNFFGIKSSGSDWKGKSVNLSTGEFIDGKKKQLWTASVSIHPRMIAFTTIPHFYSDTLATNPHWRQKRPNSKHIY